jgi:hypothetical protein
MCAGFFILMIVTCLIDPQIMNKERYKRNNLPGYILLAIFIVGLGGCEKKEVEPPEAVVFDNTIEWGWPLGESYGGNSFYWWHRSEESGVVDFGSMSATNWKSPNNFEEGNFYLRFEVLEQPTDSSFYIQFGIWQDLDKEGGYSETVSSISLLEGGNGSYVEAGLGTPSTWWQKRGDAKVDFKRPEDFYRIGLVLWKEDPLCLPMAQGWNNSNQCPNPETEALNFFPMTARVTVVAVAEGSTFSGWDNYQ